MNCVSPGLDTTRMTLRPFAPGDVAELHALFTEPDVRKYLLDDRRVDEEWVRDEVRSSQRRFADGSCGIWCLRERGRDSVIGFTGFRPFFHPPRLQLLYGLTRSRWGRGLATEAARAAMAYSFGVLGFERIEAAADVPNAASIRVMRRLGMSLVERTDDGPAGTVVYALERDAWEAGRGSGSG